MTDLEQQVSAIAEMESAVKLIELEKKQLLDRVIPADVKVELESIEAEYNDKAQFYIDTIQTTKEYVNQQILEHGGSVKGVRKQVVFNQGRKSWDSKKLERLAKKYPEILEALTYGQPYVVWRDCE
jgi:flagellar hook assembly protein FlgD